MNVGTSCMRHLPRYASVACTANSRSHSPKTYIVAMIQEGYFCSLCLFKKLATLSLMPLPTPEFLPSSFFLFFFGSFGSLSETDAKKGSTKSWDRTQVHSTMRYCDSATFVKDLQRCPSRFGIHACTKFRCQSTVKWFQVTRQFLKFQDFQCLRVLQCLTCSLIGTKAYGHGMSSNLELDLFQNPSECATLGIYLRIFQHLGKPGNLRFKKLFFCSQTKHLPCYTSSSYDSKKII